MAYKGSPLRDKRILITCGPTWVPIDDVRVISNISSGALGQMMAWHLTRTGAKVTLLEGPVATPLKLPRVQVLKFSFFDELRQLMAKELRKDYAVVIHAAAVADYKVLKPATSKIDSRQEKVVLELIPTPKLINGIKELSPCAVLVGFKLESRISSHLAVEKSCRLFQEAGCDLVVANRMEKKSYEGYIVDKEKGILAHEITRQGISRRLIHILSARL